MSVTVNSSVFSVVTPRGSVSLQRFARTCLHHFQGQKKSTKKPKGAGSEFSSVDPQHVDYVYLRNVALSPKYVALQP
jgi:putative heme iron utilization protein